MHNMLDTRLWQKKKKQKKEQKQKMKHKHRWRKVGGTWNGQKMINEKKRCLDCEATKEAK